MKDTWVHLVPQKRSASFDGLRKFLGSAAALMSIEMRDMVMATLEDIRDIFELYKVYYKWTHFKIVIATY
jgi:hypothetical protein